MGNARAANAPPARQAARAGESARNVAAIRALDARFLKAIQTKDVKQIIAFYAPNAVAIWPGSAMANGKANVAKLWAETIAAPGFALTFAPFKTVVSRSGDLAYEIGNFETTQNDKSGRPQTSKAKYVLIWGKQADGSWKVITDISTTTP
jgi:uncharacterized protein (TIGR02246 family)